MCLSLENHYVTGHDVGDVDIPPLTKSSLFAGTLASLISIILLEKKRLSVWKSSSDSQV